MIDRFRFFKTRLSVLSFGYNSLMTDKTQNPIAEKLRLLSPRNPHCPPVVLCIGSDRVTGDCLGPLVGQMLSGKLDAYAFVYGSLSAPVTALNVVETVRFIKKRHPQSLVIAVDSSVGDKSDVGSVRVMGDGIYPGAAGGKSLPKVGDVSVTATVADMGGNALYGVKLGFVYSLAEVIASAIAESLSA